MSEKELLRNRREIAKEIIEIIDSCTLFENYFFKTVVKNIKIYGGLEQIPFKEGDTVYQGFITGEIWVWKVKQVVFTKGCWGYLVLSNKKQPNLKFDFTELDVLYKTQKEAMNAVEKVLNRRIKEWKVYE